MKKTLIALALAATIPVVYAAGHGSAGHHGARWERMASELELSEAQKTQVRTVFEEQRAEREALRDQTRARLSEVLTPEQMEQMEQMRAQHKDRGKHHRGRDCGDKEKAAS